MKISKKCTYEKKKIEKSQQDGKRLARKACGALKDLWKKRHISREAKVGMYEGIIEPSLLYGSEAWTLKLHERKRIEAVEMQ